MNSLNYPVDRINQSDTLIFFLDRLTLSQLTAMILHITFF